MNDDLVTRLRERCAGGGETRRLLDEAADMIDRLRQEMRETRHLLEAANYELARLAIDLRDCRRGLSRG